MGYYLRNLLTDLKYYGTMLPRVPVPIMRQIQVKVRPGFCCCGGGGGGVRTCVPRL